MLEKAFVKNLDLETPGPLGLAQIELLNSTKADFYLQNKD